MKYIFLLPLSCLLSIVGCSQNVSQKVNTNKPSMTDLKVGDRCEDCEAIYECPVAFDQLNEVDTLPDFADKGPKLFVSGIMYKKDGKTPAADVVMYFYHTDQEGIYPKKGNEQGAAKRHGYLRSWIKTDKNGAYKFYTLVPASYPNSSNPKHIHAIIKEPGKTAYWIDDFHFADDPLLPAAERNRPNPHGGSGVLQTTLKNGMFYAERNIILGLNISGYPN
jgi:protocatechuate 3,4-dioxygenase, beta subunit